jgi:hypothetical protein
MQAALDGRKGVRKEHHTNGYRMGRLKTAEGAMEYSAPQIAGRDERFRSAIRQYLKGHTQGLEDLAIESAWDIGARHRRCIQGRERSAAVIEGSRVAVWEDYQAFAQRDLSEHEITLAVKRNKATDGGASGKLEGDRINLPKPLLCYCDPLKSDKAQAHVPAAGTISVCSKL